jgi:palmitoyltransferase ZDHHC9/14/18
LQTTYENFRYHYDKKDNPYRKSIAANFAEVFFTKIPPPMNDFRSWVGEGALEAGFYTPYIGLDVTNPREKIDLDMESKEVLVGGIQIPTALQNIDYGSFEESSGDKNRNAGQKSAHFPIAWAQGNEAAGTSAGATVTFNNKTSDDGVNEFDSPNTTTTQASTKANTEPPGEGDTKETNSSNIIAKALKECEDSFALPVYFLGLVCRYGYCDLSVGMILYNIQDTYNTTIEPSYDLIPSKLG